jgi:hypothetical protein
MAEPYWNVINRANKRSAKKAGKNKSRKYNINTIEMSPGGNSMYTGAGPDGIVQPDRPALVDMSGGGMRVLHEDEIAKDTGNGVSVTPSPKTQFMQDIYIPKTEREQFEINKMMEESAYKCGGNYGYQHGGSYKNVPGYQQGGQYNYNQPSGPRPPIRPPYKPPVTKPPINVGPTPTPVNPNIPNIGTGPDLGIPTPVDPNIPDISTGGTTPNLIGNQIGGQTGKIPFNTGKIPFNTGNVTIPDIDPLTGKVPVGKIPINQQGGVPWNNAIGNIGGGTDWLQKWKNAQQGIHDPLKDPNILNNTVTTPDTTGGPIQITDPHGVVDPFQVVPDDPYVVDPNTITPVDQTQVTPDVTTPDQTSDEWKNQFMKEYEALMKSGMDQYMASTLAAQKASAQRSAASPYLTEGARLAGAAEQQRTAELVGSDLAQGMMKQTADQMVDIEKMGIQQSQFDKQMGLSYDQLAQNKAQFDAQLDFAKEKYGDAQIFNDIAGGMTYDQIKAKYPNVSQEDYDSMVTASPLGLQKYEKQLTGLSMLLNAGNYDQASEMFKSMGLGDINFDKVEAIDNANTVIGGIDVIINSLGPDADPNILAFLGGLKGSVWSNVFQSLGIQGSNGTVLDPNGNTVNIGDLTNGINNDTLDPNQTETVLNIGKTTQAWLDEMVGGEIFKAGLISTQAGSDLLSKFESGDEAAGKEYGALIGAAFAQDNGGTLNDTQKDLLKKYDLYDETIDVQDISWDSVAPYDQQIKDALKANDADTAAKIYNNLKPKEQELLGPYQEYVDKHEDYTQAINALTFGTYDEVVSNFPTTKDDPLYQDLLQHESTLDDMGSSKEFEYSGGGNDAYGFSNLGTKKEPKVKAGDIVNVDGNLLIFKEMKNRDQSGTDQTVYFFYDPSTGDTKKIRAAKGKTSWQTVG